MGLTVKDGAGVDQTLKTTEGGGAHTPHHNLDKLGDGAAPVGSVDVRPVATVLRKAISENTSGDKTLVAASAGKKVKVLGATLIAAGDVDVQFRSGTGPGTALTGVMSLARDGNGFVANPAPVGYHHFETVAGEALILNLSAAIQAGGWLVYVQEA